MWWIGRFVEENSVCGHWREIERHLELEGSVCRDVKLSRIVAELEIEMV